MKKAKVAIVRGKFLNKYELQFYEPLARKYDMMGIGSKTCFHDDYRFPVIKLFSPVDLPYFPYKMPILNRLFIDANYLFGLENEINGFDIAHSAETYYHYTIQCLNAKKKGLVKKVIVSVFENIPFAGEGIWGRKSFKKRVFNEADHIIAVSNKTKKALLFEGCLENKISVVTQHIDTKLFHPPHTKHNKQITILFTGRLEIYKGVFDFVKAAKIILKNKPLSSRIKFMMVGQGSQKSSLIYLENKLGIEQYFTHLSLPYNKMPQIYQKADIFIAPSKTTKHWQEQFSTVLLEAKASGLAIISTNTGGIPENVGMAGFLVNEGDYKKIAELALKLINSSKLKEKMGNSARADALKRFTLNSGASKIDAIYRKVLSMG